MKHLGIIPVVAGFGSATPPNIYFVGSNPLAAEYVIQLLGEKSLICPTAFDSVVGPIAGVTGPVFIFDNCCLLPPLGECLRQLQPCYPDARYIVIDSQWTDVDTIQMLALGVHGIIKHDEVVGTLREAVLAVWDGRIWVADETMQRYVKCTAVRGSPSRNGLDVPTRREGQVLELARERFTNKEMGEMLGVQESTIKFHLSNIYSKLQIVNRLQLTPADRRSRCWSFHVAA